MKKVPIVVTLSTLFAVFYNIAPHINVSEQAILFMFACSPLVVIATAYVILKYGKPSVNTWDERFYDDWSYRRNGKEELDENV